MNWEAVTAVLFFAMISLVTWRAGWKWDETRSSGRILWRVVFILYLYVIYTFADNLVKR